MSILNSVLNTTARKKSKKCYRRSKLAYTKSSLWSIWLFLSLTSCRCCYTGFLLSTYRIGRKILCILELITQHIKRLFGSGSLWKDLLSNSSLNFSNFAQDLEEHLSMVSSNCFVMQKIRN